MKSKVNIKSHPLHPILITFPIAFFVGTFLAHAIGWWFNKPVVSSTAYYLNLGGVVFAILAAITGFIDFLYAVPSKSSGKKRAAQHGIINVIVLLIFVATFLYRRTNNVDNLILLIAELVAVVLLGIAGWLGGTLVYRNQIGVDHRYANAGKWNETYLDQSVGEIVVASTDELKVNAMKLLHIKDKRIVLARTEDGFVAFDDHCTHRGASLADGSLACNIVQCPWHGSQFDVTNGNVKAGPAKEKINTYTVKEQNRKVIIVL